MIHGMSPYHRTFPRAFLILMAGLFIHRLPLLAETKNTRGAEKTAHLELTVRVYGASIASPRTLGWAEKEAARMLREVHLNLIWVNCRTPMPTQLCFSKESETELTVRIVSKTLPGVSSRALGVTSWPERPSGTGAAFIFYDRILAARTHSCILPVILGRTLAHEIMHLLLPAEPHTHSGLMRGQWNSQDLERISAKRLGFSEDLIGLVHASVLQRMLGAKVH